MVQVVVVGGGAGGVELSLALHYRLGNDCPGAGHQVKCVPRCLPMLTCPETHVQNLVLQQQVGVGAWLSMQV